MSLTAKSLYLPLSLTTSVVGGIVAGAVFNRVWNGVSRDDQPPPSPKDLNRSTAAVLSAAALQGLVFGLVRAGIDRAGARGFKAVTDEQPPI